MKSRFVISKSFHQGRVKWLLIDSWREFEPFYFLTRKEARQRLASWKTKGVLL